jgi:hypothetical protein
LKYCLFLFFICLNLFSGAQIIDNRLGNAFKEEMFFNQEFLWQNKIKTITGLYSVKRTGRPIEQKRDIVVYRFNSVGLLDQIDKVETILQFVDSSSILFKRNDLGEVELRSENGTKGYSTTHFNYDGEGRLIRMDFGKAENISEQKGKLEPGQTFIVNSESFEWGPTAEGILRKSNFNNYGLHYSNTTVKKNELGYILSEVEELIMSNRTTTRNYSYNEKGWIAKIETSDNLNTPRRSELYSYDDLGNLVKVEYLEGEVLLREVEVLYTETMLIEAFLDHDIKSHDIIITKFKYEFH